MDAQEFVRQKRDRLAYVDKQKPQTAKTTPSTSELLISIKRGPNPVIVGKTTVLPRCPCT